MNVFHLNDGHFRARQAAAGLSYLEENKVLHRDIGLRNLLASAGTEGEKYTVKVSNCHVNHSDTHEGCRLWIE
jgi:serine/threonine protein kinase